MKGATQTVFLRTRFSTSAIRMGVGVCALLLAAATVSRADIVFSNFGPGFSYQTDVSNTIGTDFSGGDNIAEAVSFTPTSSDGFSSLDIALSCIFSCLDNLQVSLSTDSGGQPGTALESFIFPAALLGPFGANNPPVALNSLLMPLLIAGTPYWITVSANANDSLGRNFNSTNGMSDTAISFDGGSTWFTPSGQTPGAFQVNGTVPEPSGAVLLGTALLLWYLRTAVWSRFFGCEKGRGDSSSSPASPR